MLPFILISLSLLTLAMPLAAQDAADLKQDYLWELAYCSREVTAMAEAVPADKFAWRPAPGVRSVSEVYMHIALGNFLLLNVAGRPAPEDLYGKIEATGRARDMALVKKNQELEKSIADIARVVELLKRSLEAVRAGRDAATPAELEKHVDFFGMDKSVRGVYLRMLVHINEHLGQSVAYARMNGIVPPWSQPAPKKK